MECFVTFHFRWLMSTVTHPFDHYTLAPIFLALVIASITDTPDLTLPRLINGELLGQHQPTPARIAIRRPGAIALPMLVSGERRALPVIRMAHRHRTQQHAKTQSHPPAHKHSFLSDHGLHGADPAPGQPSPPRFTSRGPSTWTPYLVYLTLTYPAASHVRTH